MIEIDEHLELELLLRQDKIERGTKNFWTYLKLKKPNYFSDDRVYLRDLAEILQALIECRIIKYSDEEDWRISGSVPKKKHITCRKLMINLPPRHLKTHCLIEFCQWVLGNDNTKKIIECSYNDDAAGDFAKFVRNGIEEQNNTGSINTFVFSDFSKAKIKRGSGSFFKWALEGQSFNFLAAGLMGSITGKGGDILIIDDPIKLAEEAFNDDRLDKIWNWYTGTFLSRTDEGEPFEIVNMTRWAEGDICGRILNSEEKNSWYHIKYPAYDEKRGMLCESILSKQRFDELSRKMNFEIFNANYQQETINVSGRLYKSFKTYDELPQSKSGKSLFTERLNYTDTADQGNDYLCSINYGIYNGEVYIFDILYTQDGMEITEPLTAEFLYKGKINIAKIESNNGGRGFARNVERILWTTYNSRYTTIKWFHQSENKRSRIITASSFVQEHVYFPANWKDKFPKFFKSMNTYLRDGKNKYDDAQDAISGVVESIHTKQTFRFLNT